MWLDGKQQNCDGSADNKRCHDALDNTNHKTYGNGNTLTINYFSRNVC